MGAGTAVLRISAFDENAGTSVPEWTFSWKIYKSLETFANFAQNTDVPYPLWEDQNEHSKKLRISITRNELDNNIGVLTVTVYFTPEGDDKSIVTLLLNDGVCKRLKTLV